PTRPRGDSRPRANRAQPTRGALPLTRHDAWGRGPSRPLPPGRYESRSSPPPWRTPSPPSGTLQDSRSRERLEQPCRRGRGDRRHHRLRRRQPRLRKERRRHRTAKRPRDRHRTLAFVTHVVREAEADVGGGDAAIVLVPPANEQKDVRPEVAMTLVAAPGHRVRRRRALRLPVEERGGDRVVPVHRGG